MTMTMHLLSDSPQAWPAIRAVRLAGVLFAIGLTAFFGLRFYRNQEQPRPRFETLKLDVGRSRRA
jgi:hypothetical protein